MAELFIELYSEEIQFEFFEAIVDKAKIIIKNSFQSLNLIKKLNSNNLCEILENEEFCKVFYTPCRIILLINNLPESINVEHQEIFGPRIDAPDEEIEGFLKALNLKSVDDLQKKNENYILVRNNFIIKTRDVIQEKMPGILNNIADSLHKAVKWDNSIKEHKWFAPLRSIICLFNNEIVKFNFCNIESGNSTFGHKIIMGLDKKIEIESFKDYEIKMEKNFVIFDQNKRKKIILNKVTEMENSLNSYIANFDKDSETTKRELVNDIVCRVEFPNIFYAKFSQEFLKLPEKIIFISLTSSKDFKCFCLKDATTDLLSNNIILFANVSLQQNSDNIITAYINAINSRLNFVSLNLTKFVSESLDSKINKLKKQAPNKYVGNIYSRIERIKEISKFICFWIPNCDLTMTENAAELCKIDLTTNLVKTMPELSGTLSAYYAKINGYPEKVYKAIEEYYLPKASSNQIPTTNIGKIISIAGKMDIITTLLVTNEQSSSSKDPYGIRKSIMSIIRIIIDGKINMSLDLLIHKTISLFKSDFYKNNREDEKTVKGKIINTENELIELFKIKFTNFLIEKGYNQNIIRAVINRRDKRTLEGLDLSLLYKKVDEINYFIKMCPNKFKDLKTIYKRITNLAPNIKNNRIKNIINKILFIKKMDEDDKNTNIEINNIEQEINAKLKEKNYTESLNSLYKFKNITDKYFKNVIKTKNKKETRKKIYLLLKIKKVFDEIIDFSKLK